MSEHVWLFLLTLSGTLLSGLLLMHPRMPLRFVRCHTAIAALPVFAALAGLWFADGGAGFFWNDRFAWTTVLFTQLLGFVIQRFSVRFMLGERRYRAYFPLMAFTTACVSTAWLSQDIRLLLAGWLLALSGMSGLIGLNAEWRVARAASAMAGRMFAASWLLLGAALAWLAVESGTWSLAQLESGVADIQAWKLTSIGLMVVAAILIVAGQWPFHRWLMDSVATPSPVSALMHAGIVNAGGIILTRLAPMFNGEATQLVLLFAGALSVMLGFGAMVVQADYKRQLVASTVAQMGFMLMQCALGAYLLALVHLFMHGFFKASLFLHAGSVVSRYGESVSSPGVGSPIRKFRFGWLIGAAVFIGVWLQAPAQGSQWINGTIWGLSVLIAWSQLAEGGSEGRLRIRGIALFAAGIAVFLGVHKGLDELLSSSLPGANGPSLVWVLVLLALISTLAAFAAAMYRGGDSPIRTWLFLRLAAIGEPRAYGADPHPLAASDKPNKGGMQLW